MPRSCHSYDERSSGSPFPWLHLLNAALLAGLWLWSWLALQELRALAPVPGPGGQVPPDAPASWDWFSLPIAAAALTLVNYGLAPLIRRLKSLNIPSSVPFSELLPGDQDRIRSLTVRFLQWTNALLLGGLWILQAGMREKLLSGDGTMGLASVLGLVYLVAIPGMSTVVFLVSITQAVREAEKRAAGRRERLG